MTAQSGFGAKVWRSDGESMPVRLGGLVDVSGPSIDVAEADVTAQDGGIVKQYITTLINPGEVTYKIFPDFAGIDSAVEALQSRDVFDLLIIGGASDPFMTVTGGYFKSNSLDLPTEEAVAIDTTLMVTGSAKLLRYRVNTLLTAEMPDGEDLVGWQRGDDGFGSILSRTVLKDDRTTIGSSMTEISYDPAGDEVLMTFGGNANPLGATFARNAWPDDTFLRIDDTLLSVTQGSVTYSDSGGYSITWGGITEAPFEDGQVHLVQFFSDSS